MVAAFSYEESWSEFHFVQLCTSRATRDLPFKDL
jgi:hypothetical protein